MRNFTKFQQTISIDIALHVIKNYIRTDDNTYRKHKYQILDFSILKQFGINFRIGKVLYPMQVFWCFLNLIILKSTLMELLEKLLILQFVEVLLTVLENMRIVFLFYWVFNALYAEVMDVILGIKYPQLKDFKQFWLECESSLLC